MTNAPTDIYTLIGIHAVAFARFEIATGAADESAADLEGRKVTKADEEEYEAANQAEETAFDNLLDAVPDNIAEHRRKLRYIQMHADGGYTMSREEYQALFASLLAFAPETAMLPRAAA